MNIPSICTKSTSFDREDAGWYTVNSVNVRDVRPDWRCAGGGVSKAELTDLPTAIDKAIAYTKQRIAAAEDQLRKLEAAKKEVHNARVNSAGEASPATERSES